MIRNEPSNWQDRRIQRRKLRQMWRDLEDERARVALYPARPRMHHVRMCVGQDVTDTFDRMAFGIILAYVAVAVAIIIMV